MVRGRRCLSQGAKDTKKTAHGHARIRIPDEPSSTNLIATSVKISDERLQVQDVQDLKSLSNPEPSGTIMLSSCSSSTTPVSSRLMKRTVYKFDESMDYKLLRCLLYHKISEIYTWDPFDDEMLDNVCSMLRGIMTVDVKALKIRITELEQKVRDHMCGKQHITEHKDMLLDIFDYVTTGEDSKPAGPCPPANILQQKYYCRKRCRSESVGMNPLILLSHSESSHSSVESCKSMRNLLAKVESFSLEEQDLFRAVDLLKSDAKLRKIVTGLSDDYAKSYLLHLLHR